MNSTFAKVYLDEDFDVLVGEMLRSHGFVVLSTQEAGRKSKDEDDQLEFAASNSYVILTHNRGDFAELATRYFNEGRTHSGIIAAVRRPPRELVPLLLKTLTKLTADAMRNQFLII